MGDSRAREVVVRLVRLVRREEAPPSRESSDKTLDGEPTIARGVRTRETTRQGPVARRRRDRVARRDLSPSTTYE